LLSCCGRFLYHRAVLELCEHFVSLHSLTIETAPLVALMSASSSPRVTQEAEVESPVAAAAHGDPELAGLEARLANLMR
jgi:pyruvate/2-oxoacid:ferredoxin oxidoreductase beta subunit